MLYLTNYHFSRVGFTSLLSLWSVGIHNGVNAYMKLFLTESMSRAVQGRPIFYKLSLFQGRIYECSLSLWSFGIHNGVNTSLKKLFLISPSTFYVLSTSPRLVRFLNCTIPWEPKIRIIREPPVSFFQTSVHEFFGKKKEIWIETVTILSDHDSLATVKC